MVRLQYPPVAIIFEPYHYTFFKFEGLKEGQIPIFVQGINFTISTAGKICTKVHHWQYPLTPAFTDYKTQDQTLFIVNIRPVPEKFSISPFAIYIALSRGEAKSKSDFYATLTTSCSQGTHHKVLSERKVEHWVFL